jgi:hypothetical protein
MGVRIFCAIALAAALCLPGCRTAAPPATPTDKTVSEPSDSLCYNDCLGNGGTREFCRSRCAY